MIRKSWNPYLFQDVYDWAGQYRSVRIAKDENLFCFPENIESEMRKLFGALKNAKFFKGLSAAPFAHSAAQFIADLNAIHPFREGNGRTQMSFFDLLADAAGHPADLALINRKTFLPAMVSSFGDEIEPLEREIQKLLS
jgi:cell filamentation protein